MHFQSKLHNNSILTGSVDSYCLVCDNYLRSEDEAFTHTEKPIHKKNMGAATRVEKFFDDRIIKVKKGYYCPFCNILVSTTTKVSIHISDANHQEKKGVQMLSRIGDNVIAFEEVAITLESWHGLMDDTCVICNTEFDENNMHRTENGHILKLVQSKCEFGDKYVYRKVDEDSFFCLICGSVFSISEKLNHHESITHKNLYNSGKELRKKIPPQTNTTKTSVPKPEDNSISNGVAKILIDNKSTEKVETNKTDIKKTDKVGTKKTTPEEKSTQSYDKSPIVLGDGKLKIFSQNEEIITLVNNSAIASNISENNQKKPENTNVAVNNEKPEKEVNANKTSDKAKSDILNRVDEFQKKGINIDFTWEKARCMRCNVYVPFEISGIEGHIQKRHEIKTDNIEPKTDLKMQPKLSDSKVKLDTKKTDNGVVLKKYIKNLDFDSEPKTNTKKVDNGEKTNIKKVDNGEKTNIKKVDNAVEPKRDTKKQYKKSESPNDVKTDTKKTNNGNKPDKVLKKNDNAMEPKADAKKTNNAMKPKTDTKKHTKKELETFAKENNMVIMPNEAYCPLCKVVITLNMEAVTAHMSLSSHKDKKPNPNGTLGKKVQTSECMETFIRVESNLGSDVILNNKYVLRQHSFHCIVMEDDGYKCMLCDASFTKAGEQLSQHMNGPEHKNKMGLCKILSLLPEEFIREITSEMYHCGYCNEVLDGWTKMQDHLSHSKHLYARRHAQWNLERCHSVIRNARMMQISSMHTIIY